VLYLLIDTTRTLLGDRNIGEFFSEPIIYHVETPYNSKV